MEEEKRAREKREVESVRSSCAYLSKLQWDTDKLERVIRGDLNSKALAVCVFCIMKMKYKII